MNEKIKKLGFGSIILLTINSIIGSGIFLTPGSVVGQAGKYAPLVYLCAAIFAIVLAITFAAAAKYVTKGGAAYAYAKAAFGDRWGAYVGITRYVSASIAWGVMATGVIKTVLSIIGKDSTMLSVTIGFIVLMMILLLINIFGTKLIAFVSDLSTIGKLLSLATAIIGGIIIVILSGQNNFNQINPISQDVYNNMTTSSFVMAIISAFYAFTGFESVASGSEDMEKPERNLPRAIPIGIFIVALVYIGIVLVSMMINPIVIVNTKEVVALVSVFNNPIIRAIILYGSLISMFGINVAASFHTPRIIEAMAKEDQVPKYLAKRTKKGFPALATAITAVIAIILPIAFEYKMDSIMIISSMARFVQFIIVPLALIAFYYGKEKQEVVKLEKKSFFTDLIIPIISLCLTALLLFKFNWKGQFTLQDGSVNKLAVISMIIGFVVLPFVLLIYDEKIKK